MLRILTKPPVISISPAFFLSLKCVLIHEVAVILYVFKYRKSQRSEGGVQGVSPWENKEFKERGSIRSSFKN
jgi:hypothetical protein